MTVDIMLNNSASIQDDTRQRNPSSSGVPPQNSHIDIYSSESTLQESHADRPYELLYSSIIENINNLFFVEFSNPPLETRYDLEDGTEQEMIVDTLISTITLQFKPFLDNHSELTESVAIEQFSNIVKEGINQGTAVTIEWLDSRAMLETSTINNIEKVKEQFLACLEEFNRSFGYSDMDEYSSDSYLEDDSDTVFDEELLDKLHM